MQGASARSPKRCTENPWTISDGNFIGNFQQGIHFGGLWLINHDLGGACFPGWRKSAEVVKQIVEVAVGDDFLGIHRHGRKVGGSLGGSGFGDSKLVPRLADGPIEISAIGLNGHVLGFTLGHDLAITGFVQKKSIK